MSAEVIPPRPARWGAALASYLSARAVSETTSTDHPDADHRVDAMCEAQDHLIEAVRAPNAAALGLKLTFALERSDGFEGRFHEHIRGIFADVAALAAISPQVDPHPTWLADRNRLLGVANCYAPMAQPLMDALIEMLSDIERRIQETPATTAEGWAAKAALLLQLPSEGFVPSEGQANDLLCEAKALLGISHGGVVVERAETEAVAGPAPAVSQ